MVDLTTYCVFKWDYSGDKTEILVEAVRLTAMENDFSFHNSEQVHLPWQAQTSTNHTCSRLHPDSGEKPLSFLHKSCYPWMISPFCLILPLQLDRKGSRECYSISKTRCYMEHCAPFGSTYTKNWNVTLDHYGDLYQDSSEQGWAPHGNVELKWDHSVGVRAAAPPPLPFPWSKTVPGNIICFCGYCIYRLGGCFESGKFFWWDWWSPLPNPQDIVVLIPNGPLQCFRNEFPHISQLPAAHFCFWIL